MEQSKIYEQIKTRLIRYAQIDTQSQPYSGHWPTTEKQKDLARILRDEMTAIGVSDENRADYNTSVQQHSQAFFLNSVGVIL